jgi:flavorubredoxin
VLPEAKSNIKSYQDLSPFTLRDKHFILFYSHGGGGKVKDIMPRIFSRIGTLVGEPVGSMGRPDQQILERCKASGRELTKAIL